MEARLKTIHTMHYATWLKEARARGLQGPFMVSGQPDLEQFTAPGEGTMAMWNKRTSCGHVFAREGGQ